MANLPSRRHLLVSMAALCLTACAGTRRASPFWGTVTGTRPKADVSGTRAYADKLPYASMLFWIAGETQSLIVLGTVDANDRLTWYTPDKQAITTYGPFIVATIGTAIELRQTDFSTGWSTDVRTLIGRSLERRTIVANRGAEAESSLRSTFRRVGSESISILDRRMTLDRIDESVVVENGRARFINSYWIDPVTGLCHKSRQQALPTLPAANIEILKFPAIKA